MFSMVSSCLLLIRFSTFCFVLPALPRFSSPELLQHSYRASMMARPRQSTRTAWAKWFRVCCSSANSEEKIVQNTNSAKTTLRQEPTGEMSAETPNSRLRLVSSWSENKCRQQSPRGGYGVLLSHWEVNEFCSANTECKIGTFQN